MWGEYFIIWEVRDHTLFIVSKDEKVTTYPTFQLALKAKEILAANNPNSEYFIRVLSKEITDKL